MHPFIHCLILSDISLVPLLPPLHFPLSPLSQDLHDMCTHTHKHTHSTTSVLTKPQSMPMGTGYMPFFTTAYEHVLKSYSLNSTYL